MSEKNELMLFKNEELGLEVRTARNDDGSVSINAEDAAFGFGWIQLKNGKLYPKWERMNGYLNELGFSPRVGKDDYIPESLFYLLGMKANNETAQKYQKWLAIEVIPQIRRTGGYIPVKEEDDDATIMAKAMKIQQRTIEQKDELLEQKNNIIKQQSEDVAFSRLMQARKSDLDLKQFADTLGVKGLGRNNMYQLLRDMGFIAKDTTRPYRRWIEQGILKVSYSNVKGIPVATTFVTPKGQEYLTKKILKELDKTFIHISDEAKDYARELFDIIGKSEEEYFAMLIRPESFRDEWEAVARLIMDSNEDDYHVVLEIEEMLSELE